MKKTLLTLTAVIAALTLLQSCGPRGEKIAEITADGKTFSAYGSDSGISSLVISENGSTSASFKISPSDSDQPYESGDGLSYGLTVADVDLDGYTDAVVQISRKEGAERYRFFFGTDTGFEEYKPFSEFKGAVFGRGDGLIGNMTDVTEYTIRDTDAPDIYTREKKTVYWGRNEKGKFSQVSAEAFTYYSETDIYCYSTYVWDKAEKKLVSDTDRWMYEDQLEKYGFSPMKAE